MEMQLPGLVTIMDRVYAPRYPSLKGLTNAYERSQIKNLSAKDLGLETKAVGQKGSPTKIINVYSPTGEKRNVVLKGTAKRVVDEIFNKYGEKISSAMGKDLKKN
jgi:electron transfer flavoprotein beta subunit